ESVSDSELTSDSESADEHNNGYRNKELPETGVALDDAYQILGTLIITLAALGIRKKK
ncbi:LPXTG cell wall anchor domain-containing protein, partial [Weissella muntiaci]